MSDKYYLQDYNSYTDCCHNTYRIERKDGLEKIEVFEKPLQEQEKPLTWWQRLWQQDAQEVRA